MMQKKSSVTIYFFGTPEQTMLIIQKTHHQIKKVFKYFCLISLVFSIALSPSYIAKYWEYSETSGTIRRIEVKRPNPRWSIAKRVMKEFCIWLFSIEIMVVGLDYLGLWGSHIGWIMITLAFRKCLIGIAIMCYGFPLLQKILLQTAQCLGKAILIGSIWFSICQPLEASTTLATNSPLVNEPLSALSACEVLRNTPWENFLEKKEIIRKRYKISIEEQWILYEKIYENPEIASSKFLESHPDIKITVGQLNRIRREWELSKRALRYFMWVSYKKAYQQSNRQ